MATVSVCMIVKNEEAVLARCLDGLKPVADEIIIVDTGSTDKTKEIAAKYTDKIFDFEWIDDFAAARNFALSKATCEYIYSADADEVLDDENIGLFLQLKKALLPEIDIIEMAYITPKEFNTTENFNVEFRPKLFRRLRQFIYVDPVHETLRTEPVVFRSNIEIQHRPTSWHGARDLAIFANLAKKPERMSPRLEMMYARELLYVGETDDFVAAMPYFAAVHEDINGDPDAARRAACVLCVGAARFEDTGMLLRIAGPMLVNNPPAEICCALGDYYLAKKVEQQAADWYTAAISGASPELVSIAVGSWPLVGLAECFESVGDEEKAEKYRQMAAEWQMEGN